MGCKKSKEPKAVKIGEPLRLARRTSSYASMSPSDFDGAAATTSLVSGGASDKSSSSRGETGKRGRRRGRTSYQKLGVNHTGPPAGGAGSGRASIGKSLVIVRFHEEDCEECGTVYEDFSLQHPGVVFLESNVKANPEVVGQLQLKRLPTYVAFRNHREVGRVVGSRLKKVKALIKKHARK